MIALDLFCGAGGASMGLSRAGFKVVGVDIKPQPDYPFKFIQADALTFPLDAYDFIWVSPPCQAFTRARKLQGKSHPDLIKPIRERLIASGKPYVIENVEGAPLISPVMLCGAMFDLRTYRHRLFEANFKIIPPNHSQHKIKNTKMGRPPKEDEFMHIVGNFSGVAQAQKAMGIKWTGQQGLREAIPPAYSEYIANEFLTNNPEGQE